jgi:hypothetical protein
MLLHPVSRFDLDASFVGSNHSLQISMDFPFLPFDTRLRHDAEDKMTSKSFNPSIQPELWLTHKLELLPSASTSATASPVDVNP